jgi:3-hydroxyisobutyrate dehydrogenase-like beta-hydroxyacid dehydrogenase
VPLSVYNRTQEKAEALAAQGAHVAKNPRDVGRNIKTGVVFVMLRDFASTRKALVGRSGLLAGLSSGSCVVNMATISPNQSRELSTLVAEKGMDFLEAPVGGSVEAARNGRLAVFAGGSEACLARVRPYLDLLAREVHHVGPVGQGSAMKLSTNIVTIGTVGVLAESLAFAEKLGLDTVNLIEVLMAGTGRSAMLEGKRENLARRQYDVQFSLANARKDLKLVEAVASELGATVPVVRDLRRLADAGVKRGLGALDFSALLEAERGEVVGETAPGGPVASSVAAGPKPDGTDAAFPP